MRAGLCFGNFFILLGLRESQDLGTNIFMFPIAGDVVFADILTQVGGRSKGCGVVEFSQPEEAQRAIRELSDTPLLGRPVFIREVSCNYCRDFYRVMRIRKMVI